MADTVNYLLEKMVPELEDLEKRKLFKRKELKEIVKKRTDFEYLLKRKAALKEDFMRYIDYEQKLEEKRLARKAEFVKRLEAANLKWKNSLCDRATTRRIMFIYERAVRKFKADLNLWLQYMEFCRTSGGTKQIQKVMTRALQLHPNVAGLWIYSACWEFEHNLNHSGARALMLQGLRMNPKSEMLWLEYLRMELTYVGKLKARQLLLGTIKGKGAANNVVDKVQESSSEARLGIEQLGDLCVQLSRTIYKNAISAIPRSISLRFSFLDVLKEADFEQRTTVEGEVLESVQRDFPGDVKVVDLIARRVEESSGDLQSGIQIFEQSILENGTSELYEMYANYLEEKVERESEKETTSNQSNIAMETLLVVFQKAHVAELSSESMTDRHLSFLLRLGKTALALEVSRKAVAGHLSHSCPLWIRRFSLALEELSRYRVQGIEEHSIKRKELEKEITGALKRLPLNHSVQLWGMFVENFGGDEPGLQNCIDLAEATLSVGGQHEGASHLACLLARWVLHVKGLVAARKVIDRFLSLPGPCLEFLLFVAEFEADLLENGDICALQRLRKVMTLSIDKYGRTEVKMWLRFCKIELEAGNASEASSLYWKAKKSLDNPSEFMAKYQELIVR